MSSMLAASPISTINYDVLKEIFVHCLPEYALARSADEQPNVKIAPLLLCQVCSSWRSVALVSPRLWSHLCYSFTVCFVHEANKLEYKLLAREVEFLQWWRENQRAIPPFLRLSVKGNARTTYTGELAQGGMDYVLEYAASAQYLSLSPCFWTQIHKRSEAGYAFVPSQLHTLVRYGGGSGRGGMGLGYSFFQAQVLFQPGNLRRISIDEYRFRIEPSTIPLFWSTLTHISVGEIETSLTYWFVLLRGLPQLEWANFSMEEPRDHKHCNPHNVITLRHLSTLSIAMTDNEEYSKHAPFSALFRNVQLPAVRTLSLSWDFYRPGSNCYIAGELAAVLKSAPTVTTLMLADQFIEMGHPAHDAERDVEPIWKHTTHLAELRLEAPGCSKRVDHSLWDMLFTEGRWLDLQDRACPVRVVTIADPGRRGIAGSDHSFTPKIPLKRKLARKAPNIAFRFTSQSGNEKIEKYMEEWDEST